MRPNLERVIRIVLASVCLLMLFSLGAQVFNYTLTVRETRKALALKEKIAPNTDSSIEGVDLSDFADLSKAAMFFPAPPKNQPPPQLTGIIGEYAIINGKMAGEGDDVDGWKVERVGPQKVIAVHGEQREELKPPAGPDNLVIDSRGDKKDVAIDGSKGREGPGGGEGRGRMGRMRPGAPSDESPVSPNPFAPSGSSPVNADNDGSQRQRMAEGFARRSPEEMAKFLSERTGRNVTPEEIQERMEAFRNRRPPQE